MPYKFIKRFFDLLLSSLLFAGILPVLAILTLIVYVKMGKPVFFAQERTTLGGRVFRLFKFRTMTDSRDASGKLLADEDRMTRIGMWLRNTSLDELPELVSIIKGDMSIIGPRPLPVSYNDCYTTREKDRFKVRGGLLPPEILYGESTPSWDQQLSWDAEYGRNVSFAVDLRIFLRTLRHLIRRDKGDYGDYHRVTLTQERGIE